MMTDFTNEFIKSTLAMRHASGCALRQDFLRPGELQLLLLLQAQGDLSPSAIGETLHISRAMVTLLLNQTEGAGLVARSFGIEDKRRRDVTITEKGEEALKKTTDYFDELHRGLAEYLGEDDIRAFMKISARMREYFENLQPCEHTHE